MNIENLLKVKAWLDAGAPERKFDMNRLVYDVKEGAENWCGSTCCIAGYIYTTLAPISVLESDFEKDHHSGGYYYSSFGDRDDSPEDIAAEYLDLDNKVAWELFYPSGSDDPENESECLDISYSDITAEQASRAIQNVIDYGRPYWARILNEE